MISDKGVSTQLTSRRMLYEFHRKQNARNPRSVHATYLVTGTPRSSQTNGVHTHDGDDSLPSSSFPLPSSSMPGTQEQEEAPDVVPRRSMLLVREEHLDRARDKFESIRGIHIYSVQAKGISDMQALTDCNRQIATKYASEDPLQAWKQYGTIQNAYVRRRTGGRAAPPPAAVVKPTAPAAAAPAKTTPATAPPKPAAESTAINTEHVTAAPRNKSDIFKSFAKTQPPKPKDVAKVVAPEEDVPMGGFSDDDDDEEEESQNDPWADESKAPPTGKSRNEREAELKAMMEREDESMDDGNPADDEAKDDEDSQGAIDKPAAAPDIPETTATVVNGRRRGRRRVMKKKTVRDEEGFLGWCCVSTSFSDIR